MSEREFGLVKSFQIDHGELDGLSPQECFVLGYELAQIDHLVEEVAEEISKPVHAKNKSRIEKTCEDAGRQYYLTWPADDSSESWLSLRVAAAPSSGLGI